MKKIIPLLTLLFLSFSCDALTGTEIGRLKINSISTEENIIEKSITLDLLKDEKINLWSEMNMNYEGEAQMQFNVGIFLGDELYEAIAFDPREKNASIKESHTDIMGKVKWKFTGRNGSYTILEDGKYTIKAYFVASKNVNIEKAELVIKK